MTLSMVGRYDTPAVDGVDDDGEARSVLERVSADGPRLPLAEPVLDEAVARDAARKAVADLVDERAMDAVLAQVKGEGLRLTGPGGFLSERWRRACSTSKARSSRQTGCGAKPTTPARTPRWLDGVSMSWTTGALGDPHGSPPGVKQRPRKRRVRARD
jgi:hypothetical protein